LEVEGLNLALQYEGKNDNRIVKNRTATATACLLLISSMEYLATYGKADRTDEQAATVKA
jgi:outer membrane pore protein F